MLCPHAVQCRWSLTHGEHSGPLSRAQEHQCEDGRSIVRHQETQRGATSWRAGVIAEGVQVERDVLCKVLDSAAICPAI